MLSIADSIKLLKCYPYRLSSKENRSWGKKQKEYHGNVTAIPFEQVLQELPELIG